MSACAALIQHEALNRANYTYDHNIELTSCFITYLAVLMKP